MKKSVKEIEKILAKHGIRMSVWGSGELDDPFISFEYNGKMIMDEEPNANFDMFEDEKDNV